MDPRCVRLVPVLGRALALEEKFTPANWWLGGEEAHS